MASLTAVLPPLPRENPTETQDESAPPAKKQRTTGPGTPSFRHTLFSALTGEVIGDLIATYQHEFPELIRATVDSLPERELIRDRFVALQVVSTRAQCSFMQQKRWRLICREIMPDGSRGGSHYLNITDYLPVMNVDMPERLKSPTEWNDMKCAPVVILSGFVKESCKFMNPNWNSNLLCEPDSAPQIVIGTLIDWLVDFLTHWLIDRLAV